jgi:hypothetical protein
LTRRPTRIANLSRRLFGREPDSKIRQLRYQLLHGIVGTLMEAELRKADIACFVVHEFRSKGTKPSALERNARDLVAMVSALDESQALQDQDGRMVGPFAVRPPDEGHRRIPLYIGKTHRTVLSMLRADIAPGKTRPRQ